MLLRRSFEAISLIISAWNQREKKINDRQNKATSEACVKWCKVRLCSFAPCTFVSLMHLSVAVTVAVDSICSLISCSSCPVSFHMFHTCSLLVWSLMVLPLAVSLSCRNSDRAQSAQTHRSQAWQVMHSSRLCGVTANSLLMLQVFLYACSDDKGFLFLHLNVKSLVLPYRRLDVVYQSSDIQYQCGVESCSLYHCPLGESWQQHSVIHFGLWGGGKKEKKNK